MALFRPILGELARSIGNNTWSHNKGGAYVRRRSTPTNPNSIRQQEVRTNLGTLSSAWRELTTEQRGGWNAWAASNTVPNALGEAIQRTGAQCYVCLNSRLLDAGIARVDTAPAAGAPPALTQMTASALEAIPTVTVDILPATLAAGVTRLIVWSTILASRSPGADPNFRQARLLGFVASGDITLGQFSLPLPITPAVDDQFNLFAAGMGPDGQISAYLRARVTTLEP